MFITVITVPISVFFFQAEDGIRDLVRSRGLGDVYKRQADTLLVPVIPAALSLRTLALIDDFLTRLETAQPLSLIHI